jgi:hypothetical protein
MSTQPEELEPPGPFGRVLIATLALSLNTSVTPRLYFDEHSKIGLFEFALKRPDQDTTYPGID